MRDLTYRGVVLDDPYHLLSVEGLEGHEVRDEADADQPRGDGLLPGSHYQGGRLPVVSLVAPSEALPLLRSAFQPSRSVEFPLSWTNDDGERRRVLCRPVGLSDARSVRFPGWVTVSLALKASDPRIYGAEHVVRVPPFAVSEGGESYPVLYPKVYGADDQATATVVNDGDSDAHPTIRVHGPAVGMTESWRLENVTNGSSVRVDATVGPGQVLTVRMREWVVADPAALIVELDGASRYGAWVTRPEVLWLDPGPNVLRVLTLDGALPSAVQLVYRDTWSGTRRRPPAQVATPPPPVPVPPPTWADMSGTWADLQ